MGTANAGSWQIAIVPAHNLRAQALRNGGQVLDLGAPGAGFLAVGEENKGLPTGRQSAGAGRAGGVDAVVHQDFSLHGSEYKQNGPKALMQQALAAIEIGIQAKTIPLPSAISPVGKERPHPPRQ